MNTSKKQKSLLIAIPIAFLTLYINTPNAAPLYNCVGLSNIGNSNFAINNNTINTYIDSDMGTDFSVCSVNEDINNWQSIAITATALEVWNSESRAQTFRYRGTYINNDNTDPFGRESVDTNFCNDPNIQEPALLVWNSRRCAPGNNGACRTSNATASVCPTNNQRTLITIWGNRNFATNGIFFAGIQFPTTPNQDCPANNGSNTQVNTNNPIGNQNYRDLQALITHELGHVIGLGDVINNGVVGGTTRAVMQQSGGGFNSQRTHYNSRHLFPYDMECVQNGAPSKRSKHRWVDWENQTQSFSSIQFGFHYTTHAGLSGGEQRFNGIQSNWGLYRQLDSNQPCIIHGSASFNFSNTFSFAGSSCSVIGSSLDFLHHRPVFYAPKERDFGGNQSSRVSFANRETAFGNNQITDIMPPRHRYLRTDNLFGTGTISGTYRICSNLNCTGTLVFQSSIPMVSAWDPISNRTMFIKVETDYLGPLEVSNGRITVHPGLVDGSNTNIAFGSLLIPANNTVTTLPYNYNMETDVTPGVACSPVLEQNFPFNCMLAWVDRGAPNARVLYTYFRNDNGVIAWSDTIERLPGANTASGLSIGYAGSFMQGSGQSNFMIALKGILPNRQGDVEVFMKEDDALNPFGGWTSVILERADVAEPPTWLYNVDNSSLNPVLIWTEIN